MEQKKWFLSSSGSGDLSLSLKGIMLMPVPMLIHMAALNGVEIAQADVANAIELLLATLSTAMAFVGVVRKIYNLFTK